MEKVDYVNTNVERVFSQKINFRLIGIGSIFYIIHFILNIVAISIGLRSPNEILYSATYLNGFTNNYLYPWIILSYEPYSRISLIIGIIMIFSEIIALILIFINLIRNYRVVHEKAYIITIIIFTFAFIAKYLSINLLSFILLERRYEYPANIYWSFIGGNGFINFILFFSLIFLLQIATMFSLSFIYTKHHKQTKIELSKTPHNFALLLFLISSLLIFMNSTSLINPEISIQSLFNINNVAAPLDISEEYFAIITFNIVISSINILIYFANIILSIIVVKREK